MTDFQIDRRWQNLTSHFSSLDEFLSWQSRHISKVQQGEALQSRPVSLNTDRHLAEAVKLFRSPYLATDLSPDRLRACTRSFLRSQGYRYEDWLKLDSWYVATLASEVAEQAGLEDTQFSLKRENFLSCNSDVTFAHLLTLKDGKKAARVYRCGNKYCFTCRDKKRKKIARKIGDCIKSLYSQGVIDRVWRFQITFPDPIAERAVWDRRLADSLLSKTHKVIRKVFGVSSRSNIGISAFVHVIGDLDIFKDRFHIHVLVIPCEYRDGKFFNVDVDGLIDIESFRADLSRAYGFDVINPQVKYFPVVYKKKNGQVVWNRKLFHGIEYDARGFGHTFLKSILRFNMWGNGEALVRADYYQDGARFLGYRIVSLSDLAKRWIEICDFSYVPRFWGWLYRYEQLFPETQEPAYSMEDIQKVEKVVLYRTFERKYDSDLGKVVWDIKEEIEYQGKRLEVGKDIQEIYIEDWNPAKYAFLFPH